MQFVQHWGDRGLEAVRNFEKVEKQGLSVHTFRKLGQVLDSEFLQPVLSVVRAPKPVVGQFTNAITQCAKMQWYSWHVFHPDLPIHDSRSMHTFPLTYML